MRITYLKLVNYIGIYNGLGKTTLEIEFSKCKNRIVMLNGENGSGKSTLMSTLHPFANTIDEKTDIILPNKEGVKEIHYDVDGVQYKIVHRYNYKVKSKTTKSYIARLDGITWEELNENGNVTSFKTLVKDIFDMEESYFKLIYVGSDVTNFIDLPTAQRKKFISNFLPNIDPYLKAYKTVSDKWTFLKKNITTISDQIKKLDTKENLDNLKANTDSRLNYLNDKKIEIEKELAVIDSKIDEIERSGCVEEYKQFYANLDGAKSRLSTAKNTLNSFYTKVPALSTATQGELQEKINRGNEKKVLLEQQRDNLTKDIEKINIDIIDIRNKKNEKEMQLKKNKNKYSLSEYKKLLQEYEEKLVHYVTEQNKLSECNLSNNELRFIESKIRTFLENRRSIQEQYDTELIENYMEGKYGTISDCTEKIQKNVDRLNKLKMELVDIEKEIKFFNSKLSLKDILVKRPSTCKDNSCSFISEAIKYENVEEELDQLEIEKKQKEEMINHVEVIIAVYNDIIKLDREIERKVFIPIFNGKDYLVKLNIFNGIFDTKDNVIKNLTKNYDNLLSLSEYYEYNYFKEEIEKINEKLPSLRDNIELLESTNEMMLTLQKEIKEFETKMDSLYNDVEQKENDKLDLDKQIKKTTSSVSLLTTLITALKDKEKSSEIVSEIVQEMTLLDRKMKELEGFNISNSKLTVELQSLKNEIEPLNKELDKVKFNIAKLEEYEQRKIELEEKFGKLSIMRDTLSPTKGIPVLFTSMFLKPTKKIANELLSMTAKGDLAIKDFEITDSDFFIKLQKSDYEILKDVNLASQGETALTSIAISMALVEQAITKYNIILLDEIDATLDASNRQGFLDMMESQLDKLGVEQTFIISHNNSFDAYPVDLVLFKGASIDSSDSVFMKNKNIVFEI